MHPDRIVVGSDDDETINTMKNLYSPFTINNDRLFLWTLDLQR